MRENLGRELPPDLSVNRTGTQHGQNFGIIRRVHHRQHRFVVLGRGAKHRRTTDVDVLNRIFQRGVVTRDGQAERIQVDRDQIDRGDAVPLQGGAVGGQIASGQQGGVHHRVQRLDPAVEQLGKSRQALHLDHRHGSVTQRCRGATGGDDLPAELHQATCEFYHASLVADRDESAGHYREGTRASFKATGRPAFAAAMTTAGKSWCSTSSTRAASPSAVSPGSTGTRIWARTDPWSYTSSTRCTVAPLSVAPLARTASCTLAPNIPFPPKAGRRAGWIFTIRPRYAAMTSAGTSFR